MADKPLASRSLGPLLTAPTQKVDLRQLGSKGLREFGGFVYESTLRDLQGRRAVEVYKEMGDNDATCGVILYAIDKLLRQVKWHVAPASSAPFDIEAADFLESCLHDMEEPWIDFLSEAFLGMLRYGYSYHETVYKRRAGNAPQPHLASKYSDGRIGWRAHASRAQDSIYRWLFSENGTLLGAEQQAPPHYKLTVLPLEKCLLFRTSVEKGNPEGRSIFRSAHRAYYLKRGIENIEGVGVERDLAGLPVSWVPRTLLETAQSSTPSEERDYAQQTIQDFKEMVINIRRDAQEGIVMPLEYDAAGNKMFDLTLLTSGGARNFDTDRIIQRYDQRIAMSALADFLLLGQGATAQGSWAMHSDKTKLFLQSIGAFLGVFCAQLNDNAVRRLMRLNTFEMSDYPRIEYGSLDQVNLGELGDFILKLTQSGMPLFPDQNLEDYIRRAANLPEATSASDEVSEVRPQPTTPSERVEELVSDPSDTGLIGQQAPLTGIVQTNVAPPGRPLTNVRGVF